MKTKIILVGGFLGAGKTTLLWKIAQKLTKQGQRVGLITNDQASSLVDTALLKRLESTVIEVSGSCFCCNFNGFADAISALQTNDYVDVIVAEPVGSCTDLSATIMQPLKEKHDLSVAPLSVLIDPTRLKKLLDGSLCELHSSALYIVQKQLEEADAIVISKTDLLLAHEVETLKKRAAERWSRASVFALNTYNDEGIDAWLEEVEHRLDAGGHLVEVDYDIYAQGEAVLGWLNATILLCGDAVAWNPIVTRILEELAYFFEDTHCAVGHVKVLLETPKHYLVGNLTGKKDTLIIRGDANSSDEATLIVNARVEISPKELEDIVKAIILKVCIPNAITPTFEVLKCLSPGRPNPTYRYKNVVEQV